MNPVLPFLGLNISIGLFWTLVQVLMHIDLVHLSMNCPFSILGQRIRTARKIYMFTCICISLWCERLIKG
jgi:hypothetical protein